MAVQIFPFSVTEQGEMGGSKVQVLLADFDGGGLHEMRLALQRVKAS
jgi:hypothetical protein